MPSRQTTPPCPTPDGQRRERSPPRALTGETPADGVHDAIRCDRPGAREESSCIRADSGVACEKRVSVPDPVGHVRGRTDAIMLDDECFLTEAVLREHAPCTARAVRRGSIDRRDHVAAVPSSLRRAPLRSDASSPQARSRASVSPDGRRRAVRGTEPSPQDDARTSQVGSPYLSVG